MGSPNAPLDLTLKRQTKGQSDFEGCSFKGALLGRLLLNINRKPYMGSSIAVTFDLK